MLFSSSVLGAFLGTCTATSTATPPTVHPFKLYENRSMPWLHQAAFCETIRTLDVPYRVSLRYTYAFPLAA
ncbi:hypothetical protein F5X99DRAFT_391971 [Biscogniauxia marginata]|nr:hypothetical protein F5X99DRAFT_391971 [Biscogniauxia marginata]